MPYSKVNDYPTLSDKEHIFQVIEIGEDISIPKTGGLYRCWKFGTKENETDFQVWQNFFPEQECPLLEVLGFKKDESDGYAWEREDIVGVKTFKATVHHEEHNGKSFPKVANFKIVPEDVEIPF